MPANKRISLRFTAADMDACKMGFVCDLCNKSFSKRTSLVEHMLIHTGEKPHVCEVCNKSFRQRS